MPTTAPRTYRRVLVLGLDCAAPQLVFDTWRDRLPNLRRLTDEGVAGELRSIVPPITVPAWACMMTSKDPGTLGIYGFRNRADYSYDRMTIANARAVREDAVWDILSRAGRRVTLVGVPPSYPVKPINGQMISCFLTPNTTQAQYTYPASLKAEVEAVVGGEFLTDVRNFRTDQRELILRDVREMTQQHFQVVRHLLTTKPWDFFMSVEIGVDRMHHAFWKYLDPGHPKHEPDSPFRDAIRDYYVEVDAQLGELLACVAELDRRDGGETLVLVVSDHGAKKMDGGICINEWLQREGYLRLRAQPRGVIPIERAEIDWDRTVAWGSGGYYARLCLNVKGREPRGVVDPADYERVRSELIARLEALPDERGRPIGTRVYRPQELYRECRGIPIDLVVLFGNLDWRSIGTVGYGAAGHDSIYVYENDTGPDDANHAMEGLFIAWDARRRGGRRATGLRIMDVGPTVLQALGQPVPADMQGQPIDLT